jgi:3-hydroxyacyl-CoA dehydrogenase
MGDLAGLDVGWRARRAVGIVAPVSDALCEAGRFGQKTGLGFFRYEAGGRTPHTDPAVAALIAEVSERHSVPRRAISAEEIVERLTFPMINEGARILEERIAARPGDIDVIWLNGYGWPAWRGGPMFHADLVGPARIAARLGEMATMSGDETLRPAALLQAAAAHGGFAGLAGARP